MDGFRRYAVYFAPRPERALGRFGAAWLGWDAERGIDCAGLAPEGLPRPRAELVATPRKYGFHGTLKAPFRLAQGASAAQLDVRTAELAASAAAFEVPLELSALGPFLALTPAAESSELRDLAAACVTTLDDLRAPLAPEEVAKRRAGGLTARQEAHLAEWGYPYVLDAFEFHLTLTGPLAPADQAATAQALAAPLAPVLAEAMAFEDLCVFGEAADGRFHLVRRHGLGRAAARP